MFDPARRDDQAVDAGRVEHEAQGGLAIVSPRASADRLSRSIAAKDSSFR